MRWTRYFRPRLQVVAHNLMQRLIGDRHLTLRQQPGLDRGIVGKALRLTEFVLQFLSARRFHDGGSATGLFHLQQLAPTPLFIGCQPSTNGIAADAQQGGNLENRPRLSTLEQIEAMEP